MAASLSLLSRYLGRRVLGIVVFGVVTGVLLFGAELGVAFLLKSLILAVTPGVLKPGGFSLAVIDHVRDPLKLVGLVVGFVSLRGLLIWVNATLNGAVVEQFKFVQRRRLIDWIFMRRQASASRAMMVLYELIPSASSAVGAVQAMLVALVTTLCIGAQLFAIAPKLTAAVGVIVLLALAPIRLVSRRIRQASQANVVNWNRVNGRLNMGIKNLLFLRIYGLQASEKGRAVRGLKTYLGGTLRGGRWVGVTHAYSQSVAVILVCSVAQYARLQSDEHLTQALIPYFYLLYRLLAQASGFSYSLSTLFTNSAHFGEAFDWWKKEGRDGNPSPVLASYDHGSRGGAMVGESAVGWKLDGVTFAHADAIRPLIQDLSVEIAAGSFTAVVGASGSGKSTLIGLLLGEETPAKGQIFISGLPLARARGSLLGRVGYVGAESFLFEGTVRENLLYGIREKVSEHDLKVACEMAECDFLFERGEGLEQRLTEQGAGLSMGQKQRIAMARALLRKPQALILDEATANLDLATERKLLETLMKLKGRMTIVASTHHQELLKFADQVIDLGTESKRSVA